MQIKIKIKTLYQSKLWLSLIGSAFFILLLLLSCSTDHQSKKLTNYVLNLKKIALEKPYNQPHFNLVIPTPILYQKTSLRSPFENSATVGHGKEGITNPLIIYPVSMLRFVGTLLGKNYSIAYVLAPDNKVYPLKVGDPIGDHQGKISKIYSDRLEIQEIESEPGKPDITHIVTLKLKDGN